MAKYADFFKKKSTNLLGTFLCENLCNICYVFLNQFLVLNRYFKLLVRFDLPVKIFFEKVVKILCGWTLKNGQFWEFLDFCPKNFSFFAQNLPDVVFWQTKKTYFTIFDEKLALKTIVKIGLTPTSVQYFSLNPTMGNDLRSAFGLPWGLRPLGMPYRHSDHLISCLIVQIS